MTFHLCSSSSFISAYYFTTLKKKKPVYLLTSFILFPVLHYYKHCSGEKCGDALLTHYKYLLWLAGLSTSTLLLNQEHAPQCSYVFVVYSTESGSCLKVVVWAYCELASHLLCTAFETPFCLPGPQHYCVSLLYFFTLSLLSNCQKHSPSLS